jgi:hypothetical protein
MEAGVVGQAALGALGQQAVDRVEVCSREEPPVEVPHPGPLAPHETGRVWLADDQVGFVRRSGDAVLAFVVLDDGQRFLSEPGIEGNLLP